ncbi:GAF and ANTAR domain-containing protein [Streptomyces chrestomyceticus]|uniref:GAF and ANTAR domain-containing protein n=1 Tax=Streptomyces chrestomyceticus TaxID=68185 RepID=UPI0036956971
MSREGKIAQTFVELADTLVADFDVIDFLQQLTARCRDIFAVTDAAVVLAYPGPQMYSPAPCDPSPALSRVLDVALREGPALDAYRTAEPVTPGDLSQAPAAWADFTTQARGAGYTYACAVPLRLRRETLGSLLLLRATDSPVPLDDLAMAQAFADAATIGLIHARTLRHTDTGTINEQLHGALHGRILIEQAKGYLAAHREVSLGDAFDLMRDHARRHSLLLSTVAQSAIDAGDLPGPPAGPHHPAEDAPAE